MIEIPAEIVDFVAESNRIEGIVRSPSDYEVSSTWRFINRKPEELTISALELLLDAYQPDARLRDKVGLDVSVGTHIAISGGKYVRGKLEYLLEVASKSYSNPWKVHCEYENLHPFTDGNGRTGRALWLWMMNYQYGGLPRLSFLHLFYYQTLEHFK